MLRSFALAVLLLTAPFLAACGGGHDAAPARSSSQAPAAAGTLTATEARDYLAGHPEALVLDVRNPDEWNDDLGHIEGAKLIPLPELDSRMAEVEPWKGKPIVAVCRVGVRSKTAAELLARSGYTPVFNLAGGMEAWRNAGY